VVNVSSGYARNYLLPQDLATAPTEANMRKLAEARAQAQERIRLEKERLAGIAEALADVEVTIEAAANDEGVLYGSVGAREVAAALRDKGHEVSAAQVHMPEPLKRIDTAVVSVVLAEEISTSVKVWVVRSKASEEEQDEGMETADRDDQRDQPALGSEDDPNAEPLG
jgi:large subunit ribosomal protein L9